MNKSYLFPSIALIILIFLLSSQMFSVPPLGKLLNPFLGVVQNNQDAEINTHLLEIDTHDQQIVHPVKIYFDKRKVPHVFAKTSADLFFSQGYITASLRLWQMDFMTYVAAGRLSEIFDGPNYLDYDRSQRRLGILKSAEATMKMIEKDPETLKALKAYSMGVNCYINKLSYKTLPLEYKLLDYKPESWSCLKSILIMKMLGNTLTGYDEDLVASKLMLTLGQRGFNIFFPTQNAPGIPVMNNGITNKLGGEVISKPSYLNYSFMNPNASIAKSDYNPRLGSNSWAVSGKKTKSGYPILASDPHLGLSLPCIWIEMQLSAPGMNVYGVSIPGTPGVIIGFNKDIAWGITNGADDVKDWYKLSLTDDYKSYKLDNKWIALNYRIEKIKRRRGDDFYDTVYSSVHGPIVYSKNFHGGEPNLVNFALRWELNKPSNEFKTFLKLNMASNYSQYKDAIKTFSCPILNFTFACKDNTIAINHQGKMEVKEKDQGRFLMDGTESKEIPRRVIPTDSLPQMLNPASNYVFSANQRPTYSNYPYKYNGYYSETRAERINEMLMRKVSFDIQAMESMQLDNVNYFAETAMPILLNHIDKKRINSKQQAFVDSLGRWRYDYDLNDKWPEFFELWWTSIKENTWDEFQGQAMKPSDYVLLNLIKTDTTNRCFDRISTSAKETADNIILSSFFSVLADYDKMKKKGSVEWGKLNHVNLMHMTNISALSFMGLTSAGNPDCINAVSQGWGPSWRMIVELGETPKAYGIYPGGQSGNMGGHFYTSFVNDWNKGKYYKLQFFNSEKMAANLSGTQWIIK